MKDLPIIAIVGATATGKSDFALALGQALGGPTAVEIINADAMQLYRGMDIGTAKLPVSERQGFIHHQLDILDVSADASVAAYQKQARAAATAILQAGKIPIYVGGSGLYLRAALDELALPATDAALRTKLEAELAATGPQALYTRLAELNPDAAARIDPRNHRRLIRALEGTLLTGTFQSELPRPAYAYQPTIQIGLRWPRPALLNRIAIRSENMLAGGLIAETTQLVKAGILTGRTAQRAIGYAQAIACLEGRLAKVELSEAITIATRQLARRQEQWFRRDERIHWLEAAPDAVAAALAGQRGGEAFPIVLAQLGLTPNRAKT